MERLPASRLRGEMYDTFNRVAYGGERIVLERYGKDLLALVPLADLALLEGMEEQMDIEASRAALEEAAVEGTRPLGEVKRRLGI